MKPRRKISIAQVVPEISPLVEHSAIGLGLDIATTEKEKSNPSSLALVEKVGLDFVERLLLRWKTNDPEVTRAIIQSVLMRIAPRRVRKLCIDATSERFFAADLKRKLGPMVPVDLVVASENHTYLGEEMTFKVYLGNLLVNTMEDGHFAVADQVWIKDDFRLVKRDRGTFTADVDSAGNHADTFDASKLALHAIIGPGGPVAASAAQVGTFGGKSRSPGWKNPFAYLHSQSGKKNNV